MGNRADMEESLSCIAGLKDDPQYGNGDHGGSEWALKIKNLLRAVPVEQLTDGQRDHLIRVLAAGMACLEETGLRRKYRRRPWNPGPKSPCCRKDRIYKFWEFEPDIREWWDHGSRLVAADGAEERFVSEPYNIGAKGIRQLCRLLDEGWDVRLTGYSTHFPGYTMSVEVKKKAEANTAQQV